jgi:hypothetical protein
LAKGHSEEMTFVNMHPKKLLSISSNTGLAMVQDSKEGDGTVKLYNVFVLPDGTMKAYPVQKPIDQIDDGTPKKADWSGVDQI